MFLRKLGRKREASSIFCGLTGKAWKAWGGLGRSGGWLGHATGKSGAWGGLGNAWECSGEFWGGLGRFEEGLATARGMPRDAWGGLGRLAEGCYVHARPFSGLAWEVRGALGMFVHVLALAVSNSLMQRSKTSLFMFNISHILQSHSRPGRRFHLDGTSFPFQGLTLLA